MQLLDDSSVIGKHAKGLMWEIADLSEQVLTKDTTDNIKTLAEGTGTAVKFGGVLLLAGVLTVMFPLVMFASWLFGYAQGAWS